ncbi:hypothetical protein N7447_002314 [Penicillium robsamsonii]|uniref:uncharacterized protein n=1 Tax=Penicillium robsamsonii TaxID=1792511 RepID=UPI002547F929|nr:uncharacterized protein N7447_002314 [Penicillium robsamsonii]KAJ5836288.1 hypothetical protein N7447_002314 [Penicillium robsamsonii]
MTINESYGTRNSARVDEHADQLARRTSLSIETETGGGFKDEKDRVGRKKQEVRSGKIEGALHGTSICSLGLIPARRLDSGSCFSWMKRFHSHTQLVRLQQVN